jgi:CelD/BcsL family acetyltransferase involved in cellulose biosynthesis
LNETGLQPLDTITIQKQGVLYDSESQYLNGALQKLFSKPNSEWDELICNSITQEQFELLHQLRNNVYLELMEQTGSYYVDLDKVREHGLLGLVSKNKKNQIKQSLKAYSKIGAVSVSLAQNCEQAKQAMDALVGLHQKYWQGKGLKGSFANPFFKQFHYQMVTRNFDAESVQLLTVRCGSRIIGVLYNFIHQHNVYFYQCGFDYSSDNKFRPGLVSHYLAIEHYAKQYFSRYDFLTGESRYKASLSTNQEQVYSVKVQRKKIRFYFEHNLRRLKSKIRAIV